MGTAVVVLLGVAWCAAAGPEITLAHDTEAERETRAALQRLLDRYDLRKWQFTNRVRIDESAEPASRPVLTLNTRWRYRPWHLLAAFIEGQLGWREAAPNREAVATLEKLFPELPPDKLLARWLEFDALTKILGEGAARDVFGEKSQIRDEAVYLAILEDGVRVGEVVRKYGLGTR